MPDILGERWVWIIILCLIAILVTPLIVSWIVLTLPPVMRGLATLLIIASYGIVAGYKEWISHKRGK